jgi:hypothetical protein
MDIKSKGRTENEDRLDVENEYDDWNILILC